MGEITVLNKMGDEKLEWDPNDKEAVKAAKKEFNRLKKEGYNFYEVEERAGKQVTSFSKNLGRLIAAPGARSTADKRSGARPLASAGGPVTASERAR